MKRVVRLVHEPGDCSCTQVFEATFRDRCPARLERTQSGIGTGSDRSLAAVELAVKLTLWEGKGGSGWR
jgi:hypothetical protein